MVKREEIVRIILEESQRMTKTPNGIMAHDVHVDRIADRLVKNCSTPNVVGRSEQLVCAVPDCKNEPIKGAKHGLCGKHIWPNAN